MDWRAPFEGMSKASKALNQVKTVIKNKWRGRGVKKRHPGPGCREVLPLLVCLLCHVYMEDNSARIHNLTSVEHADTHVHIKRSWTI